jgi:hypothetical protein
LGNPPAGSTVIALPYVSKIGFSGDTFQSVVIGMTERGLRNCKFLFLRDHTQVHARNVACQDTIDENCDYLFFVDSDMDFPPNTLDRLKACDADIACTDMWARNWPSFRTVLRLSGADEAGKSKCLPVPDWPTGVEDIDVCGMACTLIKKSLLVRMKEKWPDQPWFWTAEHGEDAMFCFKAKELGASLKCDFGIVAGHWGVARMAGQDYTRDARNQPMKITDGEMMKRMAVTNLPQTEGAI